MKKVSTILFVLVAPLLLCAQVDLSTATEQFKSAINRLDINQQSDESIGISSEHVSSVSGIHHIYFQQKFDQIDIYNAVGSGHFDRQQNLITTHQSFESKVAVRINTTQAILRPADAIIAAAKELKYDFEQRPRLISPTTSKDLRQVYNHDGISRRDIPLQLVFQPMENGELRLAWNLSILELNETNWWNIRIDAITGQLLDKNNWMVSCDFGHRHVIGDEDCESSEPPPITASDRSSMASGYRVYALPLQSPADGDRTLEIDPEDSTASPFGWHDTDGIAGADFTITRGNNAHAYDDGDNSGFSPDGGAALNFDFVIDTTYSMGNPSEPAAITNLFYWSNIMHDIYYQYGYDEAAGNFQENNYGNGGLGSDYVNSEAQDGSGTCNANFGTPNDGSNPTMQMYVCSDRDGDLDNLVIAHEYGHGISNRLTGGGNNTNCLNNSEQMGEGWSDWMGLILQIQLGDSGTDAVGVGTWLTGESINGPGIRTFPYSTDLTVNSHTYGDVAFAGGVHARGSIWCAMLWELTWALIDKYGFDPDVYAGTGGNNIALTLVTEGMKIQPCSPGFVDGRDAILLVDQTLFGGANQCLIWDAFAKRGLGSSADQGSSGSSSDGTEAFDTPGSLDFKKEVDKLQVGPGDTLTYTITLTNPVFCNLTLSNVDIFDSIPNHTFYVDGSASDGGSASGNVVSFPLIDTIHPGDSLTRTFSVYIDPVYTLVADFTDDMESGSSNWTATTTSTANWAIDGVNPHDGTNSWFANDVAPSVDQFLQLNSTIVPSANTKLNFWHDYNTEARWDGGVVQYSIDGGTNWLDLGSLFTMNGYNSTIDNSSSSPAFSGSSNGYIQSVADLSSLSGQNVDFRFWMSCDGSVNGVGWYIDDVAFQSNLVNNTAYFNADGGISRSASLSIPTNIQNLQCLNGIQDGDETDIDCGGSACPACPDCFDGIMNGDETGIDCGGTICDPCPTCEDGVQNQDETGIDCGGAFCAPCPCIENDLTLVIILDNFPQETSWALHDTAGVLIDTGGTYGSFPDGDTISFDFCLPNDCYEFIIYDTYGDGICCGFGIGAYTLINNADSSIIINGGSFGSSDTTNFCLTAPAPTSCDSLLIANGIIAADTYHAANILRSTGTVQSPDEVIFKAGQAIELNAEFEVQLGAQLTAEIEACVNAMNLIQAQKIKHSLQNKQ